MPGSCASTYTTRFFTRPARPTASTWIGSSQKVGAPELFADHRTADRDLPCFSAAQKIVAQRRQVALQACKSLPNSPSHSGGSTPGSASFPGQVARTAISSVSVRLLRGNIMSSLCLRPAEICLFFCEGSSSVCSSPLQLLQTDVT